jgi:hypothetical protein
MNCSLPHPDKSPSWIVVCDLPTEFPHSITPLIRTGVLVRVDFADHAITFRAEIAPDLVEEIEDAADLADRTVCPSDWSKLGV